MASASDCNQPDPAIDWNTITLDLSPSNNAALDSIIYTSTVMGDTITLGPAGHPNTVWTTTGSGTYSLGDLGIGGDTISKSSTLSLKGEDADIDINGVSLMETLRGIQDRLNMLSPNTELESEWEELHTLGERYRALEKQIKEKMATWDRLKAMPPPVID